MTEPSNEKTEAFMAEFIPLALKHGIIINGCGCCGSPWLANLDEADEASIPNRKQLGLGEPEPEYDFRAS